MDYAIFWIIAFRSLGGRKTSRCGHNQPVNISYSGEYGQGLGGGWSAFTKVRVLYPEIR